MLDTDLLDVWQPAAVVALVGERYGLAVARLLAADLTAIGHFKYSWSGQGVTRSVWIRMTDPE
jgi:hypothetical protein